MNTYYCSICGKELDYWDIAAFYGDGVILCDTCFSDEEERQQFDK